MTEPTEFVKHQIDIITQNWEDKDWVEIPPEVKQQIIQRCTKQMIYSIQSELNESLDDYEEEGFVR